VAIPVVLFLGWLIPGAGHAAVGQWRKGLFFFGLLIATAVTGFVLTDWQFVRWQDNYFYYPGKFGSGFLWLICNALTDGKPVEPTHFPRSFFDPGLLYICATGLLNVVVVFNIFRPIDETKDDEKAGGDSDSGDADLEMNPGEVTA
jgi:hypothetical protein